jgi:hypothetical protein
MISLLAGSVRAAGPDQVATETFSAEVTGFLEREIAAHVKAVPRTDPPPESVLGVPTKGDFTWGSFMRALTSVTALTGARTVGGREVAPFLGQLGLIEARQGGKTFAQLGAALALRQQGADLAHNALWQSLTPAEQAEWRGLLDPGRFYNRKTRQVIDLPENYLGVASRIVALDWELGLEQDRAFVDDLLERAAEQFMQGALYTDDAIPAGRYDRYSQEYARFVYEAAGIVGRKDIQQKIEPALHAAMRLWWELAGSDGYGYPWGRTLGAISYQDTMEIIAFLAVHPQFRPAPLAELASVYHAAWRWLQQDYQPEQHLLNMFGFGRGNYNYMTPSRQWQQTTAFLFKSADSFRLLVTALRAEKIDAFPIQTVRPLVARFEWFRRGDRPAGVWVVRTERVHFTLPFTTGPAAGIADYLPAPHALPGFAAPVQQLVPAIVPHLELADGTKLIASDCADAIEPAADGRGVRAVWRRWVKVGGEPAAFVEPGLTAAVEWTLEDDMLVRHEKISAEQPIAVRRFTVNFPSTCDRFSSLDRGWVRLEGREALLEVGVEAAGMMLGHSVQATGNSALGKGTRGAIPLILEYAAENLTIAPGRPLDWTMRVRSLVR